MNYELVIENHRETQSFSFSDNHSAITRFRAKCLYIKELYSTQLSDNQCVTSIFRMFSTFRLHVNFSRCALPFCLLLSAFRLFFFNLLTSSALLRGVAAQCCSLTPAMTCASDFALAMTIHTRNKANQIKIN